MCTAMHFCYKYVVWDEAYELFMETYGVLSGEVLLGVVIPYK
jgi:hypothetical protein